MEGLFVESTHHCLRIITPEWQVLAAARDEGWVGTARCTTPASTRWITLETPTRTYRGVFDGADCIAWDHGEKWHRLRVSCAQWTLLTRRPYVPATLVLVAHVCAASAARWVYALLRG